MDLWYGLTMADIRAIEDKTKAELDAVCCHPVLCVHSCSMSHACTPQALQSEQKVGGYGALEE